MNYFRGYRSRFLGEEQTAFERFYENNSGWIWTLLFLLLVAIVIAVGIIWLKLSEKKAKRSVTVLGHDSPVDSKLIRRINLVGREPISLVKGDIFIAPLIERDGYDFGGWFYDTACTIPYATKKITKDITLYPKWIKHS